MRINQYELIKLYNDCVDKRDFINSCIDKYSIETSAWENYWDLIDATIDIEAPPSKAESAETSTNKQSFKSLCKKCNNAMCIVPDFEFSYKMYNIKVAQCDKFEA